MKQLQPIIQQNAKGLWQWFIVDVATNKVLLTDGKSYQRPARAKVAALKRAKRTLMKIAG